MLWVIPCRAIEPSQLTEESKKWHSDFGKQYSSFDKPIILYDAPIPIEDRYPE